jgi:hypothetical protein
MSVIVPCLYNSYSFTSENISGKIVYYDINNRQKEVINKIEPRPVIPELLFNTATNGNCETRTVTTDTDIDTDADTDTDADADAHAHADTDTDTDAHADTDAEEVQFHPDSMKQYICRNDSMKTDSLLWAIYIMVYGIEKYEIIENHFVESNRFKFELIELLRQNKPKLKANKLKLSVIEESLIHKPFITLETFHGIAVCKSLSVCIVQDRKYYDIISAGDDVPFIIEKIKGQYSLYIAIQSMILSYMAYIRTNYWRMESISSPIRTISAYKLQDLIDISTKLGLPVVTILPGKFGSVGTEKRKTKPELYEAICRCV